MSFPSQHLKATCYEPDITIGVDLGLPAGAVLVMFLHHEVTLCPPPTSAYFTLWKEATVLSPYFRDVALFHLFEGFLHKLFRNLLHRFHCLYQYECMDIYFLL